MSFALSGKKPPPEKCLFIGTFKVANEHAEYVGGFARFHPHLTDDVLWMNDDLCIPLSSIRSVRMLQSGLVLRQYALQIVFKNPVSGDLDGAQMCDVNIIGWYSSARLNEFKVVLEKALSELPSTTDNPRTNKCAIPKKKATLFQCVRTLISSTKSLEERNCSEWIEGLEIDRSYPEDQSPEVREKLRLILRRRGECPSNLAERISEFAFISRLYASWNVFWRILLPSVILLTWLIPSKSSATPLDIMTLVIFVGLFLFGYGILLPFILVLQNLLFTPFVLITNYLFNLNVEIKKGRDY